jgi:glucose-6-phosphate 1-epimerase
MYLKRGNLQPLFPASASAGGLVPAFNSKFALFFPVMDKYTLWAITLATFFFPRIAGDKVAMNLNAAWPPLSDRILPVTDALSLIDALNSRFGIPGIVQIVSGNGGLPKVRVTSRLASAELYLHGAHVTSWQPADAEEVIFLSEHSLWEDGRAIRGGIPVCFPWFRAKADDPHAPAHGVVRTREWRLDSINAEEDGSVIVSFSTESDASTRRWWPHEFRLLHRVTISATLQLELVATNVGPTTMRFEEALHTYFRVGQADNARVRGLDQVAYLDNMDGNRRKIQSGDVVFAAPIDNAYLNTGGALQLIDPILHRAMRTDKVNSATTVVWNPWQQGAAALADLGNDEWRNMACVEASNILDAAVPLAPGEEHTMRATLSVAAE